MCFSRYVFDYHPGEVYWCTADIGWITGHSYITYGPLANGATSVLVFKLNKDPDYKRDLALAKPPVISS